MIWGRRRPRGLSIIALFYEMRRAAPRTLFSLSRAYQQLDSSYPYEVVALDNGSTDPLTAEEVRSFGPEFRYHFVNSEYPSPCATINQAVAEAHFDQVMILIDGARMLSPGILSLTAKALETFEHPFIYSIGMHLGAKPQNYLVAEGYNETVEDSLLASIDWQRNGYSLFTISSPALSSKRGFFSRLTESNCFALRKKDFARFGGYEPRFTSAGGGLANLDFFNRANEADWIQPIMLLGEASFHQFHGGVATNVPLAQHPWSRMLEEYSQIMGVPYLNRFRPPLYFGSFREECASLYQADPLEYPDVSSTLIRDPS